MAMISRVFISSKYLNPKLIRIIGYQPVKQCHWLPNYKPGPYPKTKEERIKAAKKYNMFPEEYEPIADDGFGVGDYPDLPRVSVDARDNYYDYDQPHLRRNFRDPICIKDVLSIPESASTVPTALSPLKAILLFCSVFGSFYLLIMHIFPHYILMERALEKQCGREGVEHYTFELDYDAKK